MNDRWIRLSCLPLATSRVSDIWNVNYESFVLKQKNILVHMVKDYVEVKSLDCHRFEEIRSASAGFRSSFAIAVAADMIATSRYTWPLLSNAFSSSFPHQHHCMYCLSSTSTHDKIAMERASFQMLLQHGFWPPPYQITGSVLKILPEPKWG